ncbi:MAG TPA: hypothetical protein VHT34_05985, partial [Clostridia bacterium]|nr:hypothetical protein [Clostridia bacterium]
MEYKGGKIPKENVADMAALTSMQEGMLFHYLSNWESNGYFEQLFIRVDGKIYVDILLDAWKHVTST